MSVSIRCSCGRQLSGPDDCAGQSVECPVCGAVRDLSMGKPADPGRLLVSTEPPPSGGPSQNSATPPSTPFALPKVTKPGTSKLVWLLVIIAFVVVGIGLVIPAPRRVREPASRFVSQS